MRARLVIRRSRVCGSGLAPFFRWDWSWNLFYGQMQPAKAQTTQMVPLVWSLTRPDVVSLISLKKLLISFLLYALELATVKVQGAVVFLASIILLCLRHTYIEVLPACFFLVCTSGISKQKPLVFMNLFFFFYSAFYLLFTRKELSSGKLSWPVSSTVKFLY